MSQGPEDLIVGENVTRGHYDRLAATYDENWAHSPGFLEWMTSRIRQRLRITDGDLVADVGCGTGLYARRLVAHAASVVCAEPSEAMLAQIPADERLIPVVASAEDLAAKRVVLPHVGYDAILLKEVLHHVAARDVVIAGLSGLLRPRGRMLVVMLPTRIGYPLFAAALDLFTAQQPDPAGVADQMRAAGLDTELTYESFPLIFPTERYLEMVRNRYMSLLSRFNDAELEAGVAEIRRSHDIQRLRNRSSHDGYQVADEDALAAVRRLLDILAWYTSTGSGALSRQAPKLAPAVAAKAEFVAGLYVTLDYRLVTRFELSRHTVYQLFVRERGIRSEYAELLLSRDTADVAKVLQVTGGELLQTRLPKLTRFLILEEDGEGELPEVLREDCRVVAYERFMDAFVDLDRHLADVAGLYPQLDAATAEVTGDLLTADERSGQMLITEAGAAAALLEQVAADGGNLLIVGRPGSGKTTLLKQLVTSAASAGARRYRFFFDLGIKGRGEPLAEFVTRLLAPYMSVEAAYVFPVFCYFARAGSVLCALDGFDEAVPELSQAGFLELFTEVTEVLSAESAVAMTSRVSFLEDSPQVRRLMDGTSLMSEKLVQQLHAQGVDPLRVPRFSVLRLRDSLAGGSLLEERLASGMRLAGIAVAEARGAGGGGVPGVGLAELLWRHITQVAGRGLVDQVVAFFGLAFLRGATTFTMVELVNEFGVAIFDGSRVGFDGFRFRDLFRAADTSGDVVAFRHAAYQELLAAEFLRSPEGRDAAIAVAPRPRLTEQVREFLVRSGGAVGGSFGDGDCVMPAGVYLVGPSHELMLRRIEWPVRLDRFPVTVARYKRFLDAVTRGGSARWDHPDMPAGHTHEPWRERLRVPSYYEDPSYEQHSAIAVNWWSAYAFARFEGKRLPTSLEWEAAARGFDGQLFPWGDEIDLLAVNCADSWSDHPLITYEAWREELDRGRLGEALPGPVDAHPANVSPFGVREMAGNVWEFTATVLEDLNEAVICGGSFDNPYRAIQASSKGTYRRRGASNAVGFRCAENMA